jgi:hypothetical protein
LFFDIIGDRQKEIVMLQPIILILVLIISIGALFGSPSSIDFDGLREKKTASSLVTGVNSLFVSKRNYEMETKEELPLANWQSELRNMGNAVPQFSPFDVEYQDSGANGKYFCLKSSGPLSSYARDLSLIVHSRLAENYKSMINDTCGAVTSQTESHVINDASSVAVTIYLER